MTNGLGNWWLLPILHKHSRVRN